VHGYYFFLHKPDTDDCTSRKNRNPHGLLGINDLSVECLYLTHVYIGVLYEVVTFASELRSAVLAHAGGEDAREYTDSSYAFLLPTLPHDLQSFRVLLWSHIGPHTSVRVHKHYRKMKDLLDVPDTHGLHFEAMANQAQGVYGSIRRLWSELQ